MIQPGFEPVMSANVSDSEQSSLSLFLGVEGENIAAGNRTEAQEYLLQNRQQFVTRDSFKLGLDYANLYLTPVLILVGIAGNLASILVLLKTFLKVKPWSLLLAFKAFVDTGYLLCLFLVWLPRVNVLLFHSVGLCQTVTFLNYVFYFLSTWSIVGLTAERYLTFCFPLAMEKHCTRRGTFIFILIEILVATAVYNFATWTHKVVQIDKTPICMPIPEHYHLLTALNIFDKVLIFVLPLILITTFNLCVLCKIWLYQRLFSDCTKQTQSTTDSIARLRNSSSIFEASLSQSGRVRFTFYKASTSGNACNCSICLADKMEGSGRKSRGDGFQRYQARRSVSRFQSSRLLHALGLLFVVTTSPTQIFQFKTLLTTFSDNSFRESKTYLNVQELCHLVSFLNFSMIFVVLVFSSDTFRTALFRLMLRCGQCRKKSKVLDDSG